MGRSYQITYKATTQILAQTVTDVIHSDIHLKTVFAKSDRCDPSADVCGAYAKLVSHRKFKAFGLGPHNKCSALYSQQVLHTVTDCNVRRLMARQIPSFTPVPGTVLVLATT